MQLLLATFTCFSQCWVTDLRNDLYSKESQENGLLQFFETDNLDKKEAHRILYTEANDLKHDSEELSLVTEKLDSI